MSSFLSAQAPVDYSAYALAKSVPKDFSLTTQEWLLLFSLTTILLAILIRLSERPRIGCRRVTSFFGFLSLLGIVFTMMLGFMPGDHSGLLALAMILNSKLFIYAPAAVISRPRGEFFTAAGINAFFISFVLFISWAIRTS